MRGDEASAAPTDVGERARGVDRPERSTRTPRPAVQAPRPDSPGSQAPRDGACLIGCPSVQCRRWSKARSPGVLPHRGPGCAACPRCSSGGGRIRRWPARSCWTTTCPAARARTRLSRPSCRRARLRGGHAHRVGQEPLLQPARPGRPSPRPPTARALYLFPTKALSRDQEEACAPCCATRASARRHHLRRRHPGRRAPRGPRAQRRAHHQPRHAARRHPAAPRQLGALLRQPALRGGRRAAHLPRRVRLAPRQRAAAAARVARVSRRRAALHRWRRPPSATRPSTHAHARPPDVVLVESGAPRGRAHACSSTTRRS
jgi:hypothetical protein